MKAKIKQLDLWGKPIEEAKPSTAIQPLAFEGNRVCVRVINGETWWVAKDVCKILGIANHRDALSSLEPDEKGVGTTDTLGGQQQVHLVNESGLYALIFKSRKEEAKRFRKWVTSEVLPSIRKTGSYIVKDRISATAKRLKTDRKTAQTRVKLADKHKEMHARLASQKAAPRDYAAIHDASYLGQFGRRARDLRKPLELKKHQTPLDRMDDVVMAINWTAKSAVERIIREREANGERISLDEQADLFRSKAEEISRNMLQCLGDDSHYVISEHPRRGRILDVTNIQLSPPAA